MEVEAALLSVLLILEILDPTGHNFILNMGVLHLMNLVILITVKTPPPILIYCI